MNIYTLGFDDRDRVSFTTLRTAPTVWDLHPTVIRFRHLWRPPLTPTANAYGDLFPNSRYRLFFRHRSPANTECATTAPVVTPCAISTPDTTRGQRA